MENGIYEFSKIDLKDLPIEEEISFTKTLSDEDDNVYSSILIRKNGLIEIRIINTLNRLYEAMRNIRNPRFFIALNANIEAQKNIVRKYTLKYDADSVRFLSDDECQLKIVIKANTTTEIQNTLEAFTIDFIAEATKLTSDFCASVGIKI